MANLTLHFDVDQSVAGDQTAAAIQELLQDIPEVAQANTTAERSRFVTGLEILAAITLAVNVIHTGAQVVHDANQIATDAPSLVGVLKRIFHRITGVAEKTPGVKGTSVDVGLRSMPVSQLSDADIQKIAEQLAARMAKEKTA
jgi:hypothetical protein